MSDDLVAAIAAARKAAGEELSQQEAILASIDEHTAHSHVFLAMLKAAGVAIGPQSAGVQAVPPAASAPPPPPEPGHD